MRIVQKRFARDAADKQIVIYRKRADARHCVEPDDISQFRLKFLRRTNVIRSMRNQRPQHPAACVALQLAVIDARVLAVWIKHAFRIKTEYREV